MKRTYLALSNEDKDYLKSLSKKRTIQAQVVDRARILLYKAEGMTFEEIVNTKQELADRIYKYFDEVNREPVVYHWKYKMDEINEVEASSVEYGNYLISVVLDSQFT